MMHSAISAFARVFDAPCRCAADPGSTLRVAISGNIGPGSAVHREERCIASGTHPLGNVARLRARRNLLKRINVIPPVQSCLQKYFCSHLTQITSRTLAIPPHYRGVSRSSRTRGGMRWTRQRFARNVIAGRVERFVSDQQHADERCMLRTAKSCGPDAPTLASSSRSLGRPNRA
jgi:hypothetical protein